MNKKQQVIVPSKIVSPSARTKNQKKYIKAMQQYDMVICDGPAGTGKAGSMDSIVYTIGGATLMKDIRVGTLVCTPDGKTASVNSIHPQGDIDIYKVIFSDGSSTECSKDHLWYTWTVNDRESGRIGSVRTLEAIMDTLRCRSDNRRNHSIPMSKPAAFAHSDLIIDPYIMGVILGDGHVSTGGNTTISSADPDEIIDLVTQRLPLEYKVNKQPSNKYEYSIVKNNRQNNEIPRFSKILESVGLPKCVANNKHIPLMYKINSIENRIELLRGLMDTDGTVGKSGHTSFTTVSKQLSEDVKFIVQSLGGTAVIKSRITKYIYKGIKKAGQKSYRVNIILPNDINPFHLSRKKGRVITRTKYPTRRFIDRVEYIGKKEAQCIYINHPDHLYLTDEFIVTHNTHLAVGMGTFYLRHNYVNRMIVVRPAVEAGERIGYSPGSIDEKMNPYVRPILDELQEFMYKEELREMRHIGMIEIVPVAYMRGRTFKNAFILCDECQNLEFDQMKMLLTRMGVDSKIVLTGDVSQSDLEFSKRGAFRFAVELCKNLEEVQTVSLTHDDIQRHHLVKEIVDFWEINVDHFRKCGTIGQLQ